MLSFKKIKRRKSFVAQQQASMYQPKGLRLGPISLSFITVFLFSLVSLFYLAQSNQITTKGYILQDLEKEHAKIMSENERLQVEAARLESLNKAIERAGDLKLTPAKKIEHLEEKDTTVVKK